ncbi:hypothetical protein MA20_42965 [Bradyrhizobium japonicum]|uniref:Uncharacterized protein n=2 Tax=Bradyrhizobium japonicum TaxID=375 RepID=A0A0A3XGZ4_BRAJP|nr:hypothetical protein MA20_42965 [Bradyrhizobium japonicum]
MGTVYYRVTTATETFEASIRHSVSDYELSIANGDDVRRAMRTGIGMLVRSIDPLPADIVAAFNAWRAAEHMAQMAKLDAAPERYGIIAADDELRRPPMIARAASYDVATGWTPVCEMEQAA